MKLNVRNIFVVIGCLLLSLSVKAERQDSVNRKAFSNSVKFSHGGFYIPRHHPFYKPYYKSGMSIKYLSVDLENARQLQYVSIGASYERRVYRNWFVGVGYAQWKDLFEVQGNRQVLYVSVQEDKPTEIGDLQYRLNYKMADLYAFYKWGISKNKRHYINAGIGASYCWGLNEIVRNYWLNTQPPQDAVTILDIVKAEYWGVVPYLAYDFWFLKKRVNIGPDFRARFYSGRSPVEYNYNLHVGVNF